MLDRIVREGPISPADWIAQGSTIAFRVASTADLRDGLQVRELEPDLEGVVFRFDARELQRTDRGRYHPPRLLLYENGSGVLENSNNASTLAPNPGNGLFVDVDFGDEYRVLLSDVSSLTLVVPEPGLAPWIGLALWAAARRRR